MTSKYNILYHKKLEKILLIKEIPVEMGIIYTELCPQKKEKNNRNIIT